MDGRKMDFRGTTPCRGESIGCGLCRIGTVFELIVAAGGDGPVAPNGVSLYGLRTGLAIVSWWLAGVFVRQLFKELRGFWARPLGHGACHLADESQISWGRVALLALSVVGVVAFRIWMPLPYTIVIRN